VNISAGGTPPAARPLAWMLRILGAVDLLAFGAVVMPDAWMQALHERAGLGTMPEGPLVGYLARSASVLYALHGLLLVYLSLDVQRYGRLIRLVASVAVLHGAVILGIDLAEGMPLWWTMTEGPCCAAAGVVLLGLQAWAAQTGMSDPALHASPVAGEPSPP
jgi:hypothetical protein